MLIADHIGMRHGGVDVHLRVQSQSIQQGRGDVLPTALGIPEGVDAFVQGQM
jgi:hypothetical protein